MDYILHTDAHKPVTTAVEEVVNLRGDEWMREELEHKKEGCK